MGRENEPMYLPLKDWQKQHADIIGTTGAGKEPPAYYFIKVFWPVKVFCYGPQRR